MCPTHPLHLHFNESPVFVDTWYNWLQLQHVSNCNGRLKCPYLPEVLNYNMWLRQIYRVSYMKFYMLGYRKLFEMGTVKCEIIAVLGRQLYDAIAWLYFQIITLRFIPFFLMWKYTLVSNKKCTCVSYVFQKLYCTAKTIAQVSALWLSTHLVAWSFCTIKYATFFLLQYLLTGFHTNTVAPSWNVLSSS